MPGHCASPTSVADTAPPASRRMLLAPHPNPMSGVTAIDLDLSTRQPATIEVYDLNGRLVRTLRSGTLEAGAHSLVWDGMDDLDRPAAGGVYFVRLRTAGRAKRNVSRSYADRGSARDRRPEPSLPMDLYDRSYPDGATVASRLCCAGRRSLRQKSRHHGTASTAPPAHPGQATRAWTRCAGEVRGATSGHTR